MTSTRPFGIGALLLSGGLVLPGCAHAQIDQRETARVLSVGGRAALLDAASVALTVPPSAATPELKDAVIGALEREGRLRARRRAGEIPPLEHPEVIARLAMVAASYEDVRAIPGLAAAIGTGLPAMRGLAVHGQAAAHHVMAIADTSSEVGDVNAALTTLRFMLEGAARQPLSDEAHSAVAALVGRRLQGTQSTTTVWNAIDVAIATGRADLRERVQRLAEDEAAVRALGILDADLIARTRRRAADRLAGVPARPTWR